MVLKWEMGEKISSVDNVHDKPSSISTPSPYFNHSQPHPGNPGGLDLEGALPYEVVSSQLSTLTLDSQPTPSKVRRSWPPVCPELEDAFTTSVRVSKLEAHPASLAEPQAEVGCGLRRKRATARPTYRFDKCLSVNDPTNFVPGGNLGAVCGDLLPPAIVKHIEDSTSRALVLYKPPSKILEECLQQQAQTEEEDDSDGLRHPSGRPETMDVD